MSLSSPDMKKLLTRYQPGLHHALTSGDFGAVGRLLKNWISVTSKCLPDGRSIFDLTKGQQTEDVYVRRCIQKIRDNGAQSVGTECKE